jgi:hypothetical protein
MHHGRFKKVVMSLAGMCIFAFPITFTPPVYAQSGIFSDLAQKPQPFTPGEYPDFSEYNVNVVANIRASGNLRVGTVQFINDYGVPVTIEIFHSDAPNRQYGQWSFYPGVIPNISTQVGPNVTPIVIGNDWGIRVRPLNGLTSKVYPISRVSKFEGGKLIVKAMDVFRGGVQPGPPSSTGVASGNPQAMMLVNNFSSRTPIKAQELSEKWDSDWFGNRHLIKASAELSNLGQLFLKANLWTQRADSGAIANVYALFKDQKGNIIWSSTPQRIVVCGRTDPTCPSDKTSAWLENVPPAVLINTYQLSIVRETGTKDLTDQIERFRKISTQAIQAGGEIVDAYCNNFPTEQCQQYKAAKAAGRVLDGLNLINRPVSKQVQ